MIIRKLIVSRIKLPFLEEFSHSLRKRLWVNNIIVILLDENDRILGAGEGAPRSYVTGETAETANKNFLYLTSREDFPKSLECAEQIWRFIDALTEGKEMNASICAIEMALLDALARCENKPLIDYFSKRYVTEYISYGAAIPLGNNELVQKVCERIKRLGITKIKLKMGADYSYNRLLCEIVDRVFSKGYDMKVDVNGVWDYKTGMGHLELLQRYNVRLLEQPVPPLYPDIARLNVEANKYNIKLMADESVCNMNDLISVCKIGCYEMINIRLSKCGGLRRSLKMVDYCRKTGLKFQIGCQLGESGLLSSAGRTLCMLSSDAVYYDGSYDNLLLAQNITDKDVTFKYGGKASGLIGPGLGVNIDIAKVKMLTEGFSVISL